VREVTPDRDVPGVNDLSRDHVEHDVYGLDGSVTPKFVATSLTNRLTTFTWGNRPGIGIFEFAP
jgi:hypothetical protein